MASPMQDIKATPGLLSTAGAMHALLIKWADRLQSCTKGSPEEFELDSIADVLAAYEEQRWPEGKAPGDEG